MPDTVPSSTTIRHQLDETLHLQESKLGYSVHNLLMVGPPGAGKSMLAQRLPGLLPPLDPAAALEVSMIHSVAGQLAGGRLMRNRPFRDPHHSASLPSLIGGGQRARPGEVSLAHPGLP